MRLVGIKNLIVISMFIGSDSLLAQGENNAVSYLKVGDNLPAYKLNNLINYPTRSASFSDFKGKLLLLDFWSTGCVSCIQSWPKLLALQKEFDDKIQIVLVNPWQNDSIVNSIFNKRKKAANVEVTLPTVCGDSLILKLFKVSGVPHVVWVNEEGRIISITYAGSLNVDNVRAILNKEKVGMPQKVNNDEYIHPAFFQPLFVSGNGGDPDEFLWYSILTKAAPNIFGSIGLEAGFEKEDGKKYYFVTCTGSSIEDLYRLAYSIEYRTNVDNRRYLTSMLNNRIVWNVKNPERYKSRVNGDIQFQNLYNYQLISPPMTSEELQQLMQKDLQRYFGLNAKWEKRKMKCLVFAAEDTTLISYKSGRSTEGSGVGEFSVNINNVSMGWFVNRLKDVIYNYYHSPYPIIDETGLKGMLGELNFEAEIGDYKKLNEALRKYKMRFELKERIIDILVISEPPGYKLPYVNN